MKFVTHNRILLSFPLQADPVFMLPTQNSPILLFRSRLLLTDRIHASLQLHADQRQVVDVRRLGAVERHMVVDTLISNIHRDNLRLLRC